LHSHLLFHHPLARIVGGHCRIGLLDNLLGKNQRL